MILLVNDDGIDAPGLRSLYRALRRETGLPVLAVAPPHERSGMSHAISVDRPLTATCRSAAGFFGFAVDGTPADCTKLALDRLCTTPPLLVISGINRGPNVGRSVFYSGTLGAAMEAAVLGLPALAVSRQFEAQTVDDGADFAARWAKHILERKEFSGKLVNLNLPAAAAATWHEPLVRSHGLSGFRESYRQVRDADALPGETRWRLHGTWVADDSDDDAAALTRGHPVLSLFAPDFNVADRSLRRLVEGVARAR